MSAVDIVDNDDEDVDLAMTMMGALILSLSMC